MTIRLNSQSSILNPVVNASPRNKQKITSICRLAVRTRVSTHCHSLRSARVVASSFRMQDDFKMDPNTANLCIVLPKRCKESHRWPRMRRRKEKEKKKHKKYEEQVASACCCREFATICYTVSLRSSTQDSGLGHGAQQWTVNTPPVHPAPALLELCRSWRCDCDVWHQILRLKTAAGVIAWFSHFPHFHLSFLCRSHTLTRS